MINDNKKIPSLKVKKIEKKDKLPFTEEFEINFDYLSHPSAIVVGNSLRQILLNHLFGWAIFAVRLTDSEKTVPTEFTTLKGVREDSIYLNANLKELVFHQAGKEGIQILKIQIDNSQSKEEYQVTGKDVKGELKVINPEIYLATVAPGSRLEIELFCRYYWGYHSVQAQKSLLPNEKAIIFFDSNYSPVEKVAINNEQIIISLDKQEEKLTLTITTNGSIDPQEALWESLKIGSGLFVSLQENPLFKTNEKANSQ